MKQGGYEKVHRHVLVGKGAVHNGVDMNPSICLGLHLDPSQQYPPVIEMFYLTNKYGRQAGMHFDKFVPQILPRREMPSSSVARKVHSIGRAFGVIGKGEDRQSDLFDDYVSGRVESLVDGVRTSAGKIPVGTVSTWLQSLSGVNDPTPGGSLMPEKKQQDAGDMASDSLGMLPYPNWGTLGGIIGLIENGPTTAAAAKLTSELVVHLTHIYRQAKEDKNPVAGEVLNYIKAQSLYLAAHVAHPEEVINLGHEIQSLADQVEYLSLSLKEIRVLTVDIDKPPAKSLTQNPYNFDHDFRVFGQLWGWAQNGSVEPLRHFDNQDLAEFGFGSPAAEFRRYQSLMPENVREYQLRGGIKAEPNVDPESTHEPPNRLAP